MDKKGFTVIELVIVILLVSILAVVIATRTTPYYSIKLNGAGEKLLSDIRYAKRLAMTNHEICGISFDVAGNSYAVYRYKSTFPPPPPPVPVGDPHRPGYDLKIDYDGNEYEYYNGIGITSADFGGTNELRFDSLGIPYDAGDNKLSASGQVVISYEGNDFTITVTPRTGKLSH